MDSPKVEAPGINAPVMDAPGMDAPVMDAIVLRETLRQMLAVLESERQALAGLDLDAIMGTAADKQRLCGTLGTSSVTDIDEECRGMLDAAKRLNEVNRQVRNLISANVSARLDTLTGSPALYRAGSGARAAYSYAAARG